MERMMRKASQSILFRGFAAKSHNLAHESRSFSRVPTIDFSSICEANDAIRLFREMVAMSPQPSFLVYNKLLSVVAKMEEYGVALYMFDEMRQSNFPVNEFTMSIVINCCCHLNRVDLGFAVMGCFLKHNYQPDVATFNTLLRGFFLVGNVAEAEALFKKILVSKLCQPNDFMILTMVDGLCKSGQTLKARNLLLDFEKTGYKPNVYSCSAIIDGLCKDGMVDDALHLLLEMSNNGIQANVVTYTTIIQGYVQHGFMTKALQIFDSMLRNGIKPNGLTFLAVLSSCAHVGALEEALYHFGSMTKDFGITPGLDHLACLVTLHARKGETKAAYDLVRNFPCAPDKIVWKCLLSGCVMNNDLDLARLAAEKIFSIDPNDAFALVMLSNLYAGLNMWEEASKVRELMKEKKARKERGCSLI